MARKERSLVLQPRSLSSCVVIVVVVSVWHCYFSRERDMNYELIICCRYLHMDGRIIEYPDQPWLGGGERVLKWITESRVHNVIIAASALAYIILLYKWHVFYISGGTRAVFLQYMYKYKRSIVSFINLWYSFHGFLSDNIRMNHIKYSITRVKCNALFESHISSQRHR